MQRRIHVVVGILVTSLASAAPTQRSARSTLTSSDVDAIAHLLMLEDTRRFDESALWRSLRAPNPEVRRRAAMAIGRIVNPNGLGLLASAQADRNPDVVATVAFAYGQLKSPGSVAWLSQLLSSRDTSTPIAVEAARSLGKIPTPEARTALATYLNAAPATPVAVPVVGEALLAIGRFTTRDDIAPVVRWTTSGDTDVRWRAAWALFRPRNPAAVPHLLKLADDPSPDVRFWAVRGLSPALVTEAGLELAPASARLAAATRDPDRRVRTEALRALGQYDDDGALKVVSDALDSPDTWLAVSAAEALGRFQSHAAVVKPRLVAAAAVRRPTALRVTALASLTTLAPDAALDLADSLIRHRSIVARTAAVQALQRLGEPGRQRLEALSADPATKSLVPQRGGGPGPRREQPNRTQAEYRGIVERWIVPDYNGAPKPRAVLTTPRGDIEVELYPAEAPLGLEFFISVVESGQIVGTEFGRVVPNFVAQQRAIRTDVTLRDEVSRRGLTRGNLSWASPGLDSGRPGYTFGITPQPHNEGDFTALGRVVRGMDVVDRLELGDAITAARMIR